MSEVKGKIYKLKNDLNEKIYIGSTTRYLSRRLSEHNQCCKDETRNSNLYTFMKEIGIEHFKIELVEKYTCETILQLHEREQYWIEQLKPELNTFRSITNPNHNKEYYETHKEQILEHCKHYREEHKEQNNKKCKEYYYAHKTEELEKRKKYRDEHKEEIKNKKAEPITCECGCIVRKDEIARHKKSPKHATLLANK